MVLRILFALNLAALSFVASTLAVDVGTRIPIGDAATLMLPVGVLGGVVGWWAGGRVRRRGAPEALWISTIPLVWTACVFWAVKLCLLGLGKSLSSADSLLLAVVAAGGAIVATGLWWVVDRAADRFVAGRGGTETSTPPPEPTLASTEGRPAVAMSAVVLLHTLAAPIVALPVADSTDGVVRLGVSFGLAMLAAYSWLRLPQLVGPGVGRLVVLGLLTGALAGLIALKVAAASSGEMSTPLASVWTAVTGALLGAVVVARRHPQPAR